MGNGKTSIIGDWSMLGKKKSGYFSLLGINLNTLCSKILWKLFELIMKWRRKQTINTPMLTFGFFFYKFTNVTRLLGYVIPISGSIQRIVSSCIVLRKPPK